MTLSRQSMHVQGSAQPVNRRRNPVLAAVIGSRTADRVSMSWPVKVLTLRRPDECSVCRSALDAGTTAVWDPARRQVSCLPCREDSAVPVVTSQPPAAGAANRPAEPSSEGGASAQREYDQRSARRERQVRAQHPRIGGLLLAVGKEPTSTRVWAQGAAGERAVASKLDELTGEDVVSLHDRRMRRPDGTLSRANIDHLAVAASGVWVIDAKTHQGALEVRRSGGLFSPRIESLHINGRDRTPLVHGLLKQVAAVRAELETVHADVPVRGALCFVGTELPWFGSSSIVDVPLVGRRGLARLLRSPGGLLPAERDAVAAFLGERFPRAA